MKKIVPLAVDYNDPATITAAALAAQDVAGRRLQCRHPQKRRPLDEAVIETFQQELEVNVYGLLRMAKSLRARPENQWRRRFRSAQLDRLPRQLPRLL